jgi:hypothetical protein
MGGPKCASRRDVCCAGSLSSSLIQGRSPASGRAGARLFSLDAIRADGPGRRCGELESVLG